MGIALSPGSNVGAGGVRKINQSLGMRLVWGLLLTALGHSMLAHGSTSEMA